jgi:DNA invertase Pin-like site-specific DNA recombinase
MKYGYARVSSKAQDYAAQVEAPEGRRLREDLQREAVRQVAGRTAGVWQADEGAVAWGYGRGDETRPAGAF